jgi:predicted NBD/HSP70 family sugar kinase
LRYTILMYLAVDIGGTKTLLAKFSQAGQMSQPVKFPTPKSYDDFLAAFKLAFSKFETNDFAAVCVGVPGKLDRKRGFLIGLGNLPWKHQNIQEDIKNIVKCPVLVENDAKLAGLYEAIKLKDKYKKVLYITLGTGIGIALVTNQQIDNQLSDWGGKFLPVERGGKDISWEEIASGRAITKTYGKKASEITDPESWQQISRNIAKGLTELIAITEPEAVVIGGGVGKHFEKFGKFLNNELKKRELPAHPVPKLLPAVNSEDAVVYGCYELIKRGGYQRS